MFDRPKIKQRSPHQSWCWTCSYPLLHPELRETPSPLPLPSPSPPPPSHSPSLSHTFPSLQIGLTSPYLPSSPFCVKVMEIVLVAKMFEVESSGAWALEGQLLAATVDP